MCKTSNPQDYPAPKPYRKTHKIQFSPSEEKLFCLLKTKLLISEVFAVLPAENCISCIV